jgi:hypothetical protein
MKEKNIRRGWCLGGEKFRQELLDQMHQRTGDSRVAKLKVDPGGKMNLIWNETRIPLWIDLGIATTVNPSRNRI